MLRFHGTFEISFLLSHFETQLRPRAVDFVLAAPLSFYCIILILARPRIACFLHGRILLRNDGGGGKFGRMFEFGAPVAFCCGTYVSRKKQVSDLLVLTRVKPSAHDMHATFQRYQWTIYNP